MLTYKKNNAGAPDVAHRLAVGIRKMMDDIVSQRSAMRTVLWDSPTGVSPQLVLDELGPEALVLFQLSGALEDFLESVKPGVCGEVGCPYEFTVNPDGTITLGALRGPVPAPEPEPGPEPEPPTVTANDDGFEVSADAVPAVIGNVMYNDTGGTAVAPDSGPGLNGGIFTLDASGDLTFDPDGDFDDLLAGESRDTTFDYTLTGPGGLTNTAAITVTVNGPAPEPEP